jgi:signal transduction histidine kinase
MTLEESKLFRDLPPAELTHLRRLAREQAYHSGQSVFQQGDPGDALYLVKSGWIQIAIHTEAGERLALSRIFPGEIFGEMAVLDAEPRSATATAAEEAEVYRFSRPELIELLGASPSIALAVMRAISLRLRDFNSRYVRTVITTERMALIGRFARSIVHDLKSPLATILMAADLGCQEKSDAAHRRMGLDYIVKEVDRIQTMVNDILEFTSGTSTGARLDPVDYGIFVQSVVQELQPEVALNHVRLDFVPPARPIKVAVHATRLARVFHNLTHNAVQAMPRGGRIIIRIQQDIETAWTEIEDTGPGIPAAVMGKLFEPFATHGKTSGTGLGLSICRKTIQEHGGEITAQNRPEGGAVFRFALPRQE